MGRKALYEGQPMTGAERQARSRALKANAMQGELDMADRHIRAAHNMLARTIGGTEAEDELLTALDAIQRLRHLVQA